MVLGDSSQVVIAQEVADEVAESGATLVRWQPIAPVDVSAVASVEGIREQGEALYYFESVTLVAPDRTCLLVGQSDEGPAMRQWLSAGIGQPVAVPRRSAIFDDDNNGDLGAAVAVDGSEAPSSTDCHRRGKLPGPGTILYCRL